VTTTIAAIAIAIAIMILVEEFLKLDHSSIERR
jgi:hypothetical protein